MLASTDLPALERALDVPSRADFAPVFVHGDLYSRHLLVDDAGRPCGVIDWGDCHVGDPAVDLMADAPSTVDAKQLRELHLRIQR